MKLDYPEPTLFAVPLFIVSMVVESRLLGRDAAKERALLGYERRDTVASLGLGIGSLFFVTPINLGTFVIASLLWPLRLVDLGTGPLAWAVALVGWDFLFYWHHRAEHRVRLLWACHVNHHSSEHFNLSTALRQPWTPVATWLFYPLLALVGVAPWIIMFAGGLNLIYQFWVHTELVGRMPRWFEAVLNTPSHHRVHHGSNALYIDKNYAGILIVWDRLFGTFQVEEERVVFGLTKNIDTFNLFRIAFHEYVDIARDVWRLPGAKNKLLAVFGPPGAVSPAAK